jgi:tRNA A37 threonylcarbamoyladenosine modification protein TsaB
MNTDAERFCVIGDARRQSFFLAQVEHRRVVEGPGLLDVSSLTERLRTDNAPVFAAEELAQFAEVKLAFPSAARLALLGEHEHPDATLSPLQPMYMREPHITESKQPTWSRAK